MTELEAILNKHLPRHLAVRILEEVEQADDENRFAQDWALYLKKQARSQKAHQRNNVLEANRKAAEACPY